VILAPLLDGLMRRMLPAARTPLGSLLVSARRRERCVVRYQDGLWVHQYREGVVVQPRLGGPSARLQDDAARDSFLFDYTPKAGDVVFDLGAGVGGEVRLLSRLTGATGTVISVEPHPHIFRCLAETIRLNGLDNVTALQRAVTETPGTFHLANDPRAHVANRLTSARTGIAVQGSTLSELMDRTGTDHIDLLKMNIEGAELSVLRAAANRLHQVDHIVVACHDFAAERHGDDRLRTFEPVIEVLRTAGFSVRTRPDDRRPWIRHHVYGSRTLSR